MHQPAIFEPTEKAGHGHPVIESLRIQVGLGYVLQPVNKNIGLAHPVKIPGWTRVLGHHGNSRTGRGTARGNIAFKMALWTASGKIIREGISPKRRVVGAPHAVIANEIK